MITVVIIGLIVLGNWQLRRLDWKLELIERVETRAYSAPASLPNRALWSDINKQDHEYQRVTATGEFLHDKEALVWAATEYGNGYWVLTPLVINANETVFINRGFVPLDKSDQNTRKEGQVTGDVSITGWLRISEPIGTFLRANDVANDRWYSRDIEAMAQSRGLNNVAPFFVDAETSAQQADIPIAGLTRLHFRNPHLIYALTWYGLALLLVIMVLYARRVAKRA